MSIQRNGENAALTDFGSGATETAQPQPRALGDDKTLVIVPTRVTDHRDGARYRGGSPDTDEEPADAGCCRGCGRRLDTNIQRVAGDNHGRLPGCAACVEPTARSASEYRSDVAAGQAVRRGNGIVVGEGGE